MNICVYGASSALLKNIYYEKTEELGRAMGKRGHGLVFGGGATGMMGLFLSEMEQKYKLPRAAIFLTLLL